jgi:hypothetical protein
MGGYMRIRWVMIGLSALLVGCQGTSGPTATTAATTATTVPTATSTATTIRVPTAREFIAGFKRAGLPVGKVICYTDETDPNNLLGRPGGYIAKCDWTDKREEQILPDDPIGGSIETFEEPGGAAERAAYLKAFEGAGALSPGYTFAPKDSIWVLRIDSELTRKQADAYLKAMLTQL